MDQKSPLLTKQKIFHSRQYTVEVFIDSNKLKLKLKEPQSSGSYIGEYSIQFIETLTHKAGSSKKFNIFLNMLISSLENTSSAVTIDLESHSDLEKLRNKPLQGNSSNSYLILTYTAEFDKVYYPLPLIFQKDSELPKFTLETNPAYLQLLQEKNHLAEENSKLKSALESKTIEKESLKKDLDAFKQLTNKEILNLQNTVEDLKNRLKNSNKNIPEDFKASLAQLRSENSRLELNKKVLEAEVKSLKLLNKKRKLKIYELRKKADSQNGKERSKSLLNSDPDVTKSTISSRCKSSVRSSYNSEDISAKLEKIVNLLAVNERTSVYY